MIPVYSLLGKISSPLKGETGCVTHIYTENTSHNGNKLVLKLFSIKLQSQFNYVHFQCNV